ncbi:tetratricopeptide repeat-containing S1 family peptidase [Streptomyces venezuelae]|uniref:tetratricopeptide repeat-containing S1 family peptidase n=1 Tax=Streptomyces venezuelae TaxID=54571 RepID=UPI00278C8CA1|nr:tetratricopeptide repeat-containing serine protease family protein [Streptomyces venezuelae]
MEFDRRVQIRVARVGKSKKGFGTGYLVAPRLVLTADHVLDGLDPQAGPEAVTVCQPDTGEEQYPATVCWRWRDKKVDAALIEISRDGDWPVPESLSDLELRPPQRYGRLIGTRSHPVALNGFPYLQKDAEFGRLDEHVEGRITPGTGSLAGRYEITSTTPVPAGPPTSGGTRWSGVSGAAVLADSGFGGDLLCGIVRYDRQADGGTRLTATPISHLLGNEDGHPSEFRRLIIEHTGWDPVLEPLEPAPLLKPASVDRDLDSPAALLRADTEAITFHGRDAELADLRAWCTEDPAKISVRLVTGPGGQGKTRLARHLTDALSHENWVTGHLRTHLVDNDTPDLTLLRTALPLLLVVDYAETRPHLLRRLLTHLHTTNHRVRILLLARSDGEWRTETLSAEPPVRRLLASASVTQLGPLQPPERPDRPGSPRQDRNSDFRDAVVSLARLLPRVPSVPEHDWTALAESIQPTDDLDHPRYANALTLQLTALVSLLQQGPRPAHAAPGTPAEQILLEHEDRFWSSSSQAPAFELGLDTATLKAAVAVAALCGADSSASATRVLATLPEIPAHKTRRVAAWLSQLYPADPDRYWGSLQPDRIAEYHASVVLARQDFELPALLTTADDEQQAQTVTVLARAATAHYNAGRVQESDRAILALCTALDASPMSYLAARSAYMAVPYPNRILNPLAIRLCTAVTQAEQRFAQADPAAYEPYVVTSLSNLGSRLGEAGRWAEAIAAEQQVVEIYRRLMADDPTAHEPGLARSLSNLGIWLGRAGRRAEALTAEQQAVEIYRPLAIADPTAHEPDLAASLSNLGNRLAQVGRRAEALTAEQEAVEIRRRLAAADPTAHEPGLALSLSNLGIRLAEAGRQAEALPVTEGAIDIYRRRAAADPATYEPNVAAALSNLGIWLGRAGRWAEALTAEQEAVEIRRRLAASDPTAHEPGLAISLSNLGGRLAQVGRRDEALAAEQEAVGIRGRLTAADPTAHEPDLARSLSNLGIRLAEAGRETEALAASQSGAEIYRRLAAADPDAHALDAAFHLSNLSIRLAKVGRDTEALTDSQDGTEIFRRLAASDPTTREPDLARSLANLSIRLAKLGRDTEALTASQDGTEIFRRLAVADPATHEPDLARSLSNLGIWLGRAGRWAEALTAEQEAVEIRRRLAAADPTAHEPDLARSLANLRFLLRQAKG